MKNKLLFGIIVTLMFFITINSAYAWWDGTYTKRQPIDINSTNTTTDYSIFLNVTYDADMQNDFDDIRFVASDDTTELGYWIQNKIDGSYCEFWVKFDIVDTNGTQIYMYYGNAGVSDKSNGTSAFLIFEDFEDGTNNTFPARFTDANAGNCNWNITTTNAISGTYSLMCKAGSVHTRAGVLTHNTDLSTGWQNHKAHAKVSANPSGGNAAIGIAFRNKGTGGASNLEGYGAEANYGADVFAIYEITGDGTLGLLNSQGTTLNSGDTVDINFYSNYTFYNGTLDLGAYKSNVSANDATTTSGNFSLWAWDYGDSPDNGIFDDIFVRKYIYPEPIFGFEAEESASISSPTTFNATANDTKTNTALTSFNITLINTTTESQYGTSTGTIVTYNHTNLYNVTFWKTNYINITYANINTTNATIHGNLTPYFKVGILNAWNSTRLGAGYYNITWNGSTYFPQSDNYTYIPTNNANVSFSIQGNDYITRTITNYNSSTDINFSFWQTQIDFNSYEKFTFTGINNFTLVTTKGNFTTTNGTTRIYPNIGAYIWNWTNDGAYINMTNLQYSVSSGVSALNVTAFTSVLNITVYSAASGNLITNLTEITVFETSNPSYTEAYNTTTGYFEFNVTYGTWNMTVNPAGWQIQSNTTTISAGTSYLQYNFSVYTTNSISFEFRDEETGALITTTNVSAELISDLAAYNDTTENGTLYFDLLTPTLYNIRYYGEGYPVRTYFFELANRTHTNLTLYLLQNSSTTTITATVYDEYDNFVEGAYIKVLKYDLLTNSYIIREIVKTNFEGAATFSAELNAEMYQFIIEFPFGTVKKITEPSKLFETSINFHIVTTARVLEDFYDSELDLTHVLTFDNTTNKYTFVYSAGSGLVNNVCLQVWRLQIKGNTLLNETCLNSASGSIELGVANITGATYEGRAIACLSDTCSIVDSLIHYFAEDRELGKLGLYLMIVMTLVFLFIGFFKLEAGIILAPVPLIFCSGSIFGVVNISTPLAISVEVIAVIIAIVIAIKR